MPAPAEVEGQTPFRPFMVEAMTVREAWTASEVSEEFDGLRFQMLEPLNAEDASVIARALNEQQRNATGMIDDTQFGEEIRFMAQQSKANGQPTFPYVVVSARPEANGGSSIFDDFNNRLHEVWQARKAAAEAASAAESEPSHRGVIARTLGRLGINRLHT